MPKLSRAVIAEKMSGIETAAKDLFIKQGFHATSMRDISKRANTKLRKKLRFISRRLTPMTRINPKLNPRHQR